MKDRTPPKSRMKPADWGEESRSGVVQQFYGKQATVVFPKGKHSVVFPRYTLGFVEQLRQMGVRPINYRNTPEGVVFNFRSDRDAVAARLAYDG